jgi:hypothetical protein
MEQIRFQTTHLKWALVCTNTVAVVCAIISYIIEVDPLEDPEGQTVALIVVRDAFSCSPRFPSFASEMILQQMHFMLGSITVALAVGLILKLITSMRSTGSPASSGKIARNLPNSEPNTLFCLRIWGNLRKRRADKLVSLLFVLCFAPQMASCVN